jgi:hypothetical protein
VCVCVYVLQETVGEGKGGQENWGQGKWHYQAYAYIYVRSLLAHGRGCMCVYGRGGRGMGV